MKTILIYLLILLPSAISLAQWSSDPYENTLVAYESFDPQMVTDGNGGAIIIYWSSAYYSLVAQRLDKYGYKCWGDSGVVLSSPGNYQASLFDLILTENGGCAIAFCDVYGEYPSTFSRIIVQRLDSLGNELWGENGVRVSDIVEDNTGNPRIENDGYGGYFVIWHDGRYNYYEPQVYGQRLDSEGNLLWQINGINISGETNFSGVDNEIVSGGQGYALVFWHEENEYLWGQRININGDIYWGNDGKLFPETLEDWNSFISNDAGGCIITSRFNVGYDYYYYGQQVDINSNFLWGDSGKIITDSSTNNTFRLSLARNSAGTFFSLSDNSTNIFQTHIQRINDNGDLLWGNNGLIVCGSNSEGYSNVVTSSGLSDVIIAYHDERFNTLRSQKYDSSGILFWDYDNIVLSYLDGLPDCENIISDLSGGAIVCWTVYPALLYIQQISVNGNLGEVLSVKHENQDPLPSQITLYPCYPNPFNATTTIPFTLDQKFPVKIVVYNQQGQNVITLFDGMMDSGFHQFNWDAGIVSSGVYLIRLDTPAGYSESGKVMLVK